MKFAQKLFKNVENNEIFVGNSTVCKKTRYQDKFVGVDINTLKIYDFGNYDPVYDVAQYRDIPPGSIPLGFDGSILRPASVKITDYVCYGFEEQV